MFIQLKRKGTTEYQLVIDIVSKSGFTFLQKLLSAKHLESIAHDMSAEVGDNSTRLLIAMGELSSSVERLTWPPKSDRETVVNDPLTDLSTIGKELLNDPEIDSEQRRTINRLLALVELSEQLKQFGRGRVRPTDEEGPAGLHRFR